jgi:hypothetical protein
LERRDLGGWILMAVLFIAAMSLIFYILLMRAQHLARMEEQRTQSPQSQVEQLIIARHPVVVLKPATPDAEPIHAYLVFDEAA